MFSPTAYTLVLRLAINYRAMHKRNRDLVDTLLAYSPKYNFRRVSLENRASLVQWMKRRKNRLEL